MNKSSIYLLNFSIIYNMKQKIMADIQEADAIFMKIFHRHELISFDLRRAN